MRTIDRILEADLDARLESPLSGRESLGLRPATDIDADLM